MAQKLFCFFQYIYTDPFFLYTTNQVPLNLPLKVTTKHKPPKPNGEIYKEIAPSTRIVYSSADLRSPAKDPA